MPPLFLTPSTLVTILFPFSKQFHFKAWTKKKHFKIRLFITQPIRHVKDAVQRIGVNFVCRSSGLPSEYAAVRYYCYSLWGVRLEVVGMESGQGYLKFVANDKSRGAPKGIPLSRTTDLSINFTRVPSSPSMRRFLTRSSSFQQARFLKNAEAICWIVWTPH